MTKLFSTAVCALALFGVQGSGSAEDTKTVNATANVSSGAERTTETGPVAHAGHWDVYYWYWNGRYWQRNYYGIYYNAFDADHAVAWLFGQGLSAWKVYHH